MATIITRIPGENIVSDTVHACATLRKTSTNCRVFAVNYLTKNSYIIVEEDQSHPGMLLVVFVLNEPNKGEHGLHIIGGEREGNINF